MPLNIGTGRALLGTRQGPVLWLRRGDNQFTDVAATTPANTGDAVAAWKDGAIVATQATLGSRPTRQAGGELAFDGTDFLAGNDLMRDLTRGIGALTIYATATPSNITNPQSLVSFSNAGSSLPRAEIGVGFNLWRLTWYRTLGDPQGLINGAATVNVSAVIAATLNYQSRVMRLYRNGVQIAQSLNFASAGLTDDTASQQALVGFGGNPKWLGSIAEIRAYHAAHDAATVARISAEMAL